MDQCATSLAHQMLNVTLSTPRIIMVEQPQVAPPLWAFTGNARR
jgi:hypothetical protein